MNKSIEEFIVDCIYDKFEILWEDGIKPISSSECNKLEELLKNNDLNGFKELLFQFINRYNDEI